jgi:hypothetical protein
VCDGANKHTAKAMRGREREPAFPFVLNRDDRALG